MLAAPSLVKVLLPDYPTIESEERAALALEISMDIEVHIRSIAPLLRFGLTIVATAFRFGAAVHAFFYFLGGRTGTLEAYIMWSEARRTPFTLFVKVLRTLTCLYFFDHSIVRRALGRRPLNEHQEGQRKLRDRVMSMEKGAGQ